jgi:gas vesicle protein
MRWNSILRSVLKTAVYVLDQSAEQMDRASERAVDFAEQARSAVSDAKSAIYPEEDHTLRNIVSFAVGIGVGVGAGILLAPKSGEETRSAITDRVHEIGDKFTGRSSRRAYATGTE